MKKTHKIHKIEIRSSSEVTEIPRIWKHGKYNELRRMYRVLSWTVGGWQHHLLMQVSLKKEQLWVPDEEF